MIKITSGMNEMYETALARANADGCEVLKLTSRFAYVSSATDSTKFHTVVFGAGGAMSCDCPARGYCKHRALVRSAIIAVREVVKAAPAAAPVRKGWLEMTRDEQAQMLSGAWVEE